MIRLGDTNIEKIYLGGTEIKKAYLGSEVVFDNGGSALPYDAEIEYLESTGTQYIAIPNVIPTDYDNTFETKITFLGYSTTAQWIAWFSAYTNENSNTYRIIRNSNNNTSVLVYDGTKAGGGGVQVSVAIGNTYDIKMYPTYALFNNARINLQTVRGNPNTNKLSLFATEVLLRFYNFKYIKGDSVIFDAIPVRVGTVGYMYDKVSHQLFGNSGTGNFILGHDKTFNPSNPVPNDEIWYTTTDNSQLSIGTPSGYGSNFVNNTYTNGKGVIKFDGDINNIPEDAFSFLKKLQTIALPDSVTAIHGKAFSNCSGLTTIQLGKGLLTMNDNYQGAGGSFTFDDCYNLSKIVSLKPIAADVDNWCFHDFRQAGSTVPCVLAIPSGATGYNNWKYTIDDNTDATADTTFYSFTTKTLEESDCLFLNTQ